MITSVNDKLCEKLAPVYRKLHDLNAETLLGTEAKVLRITTSAPDVMGDVEETFTTEVIDNAIIKHPFSSSVQVFAEYSNITNQLETGAIDLWEVLPVELRISFNEIAKQKAKENNTQVTKPEVEAKVIELKRGDMIVEVLVDDNSGSKLPLVFQISRIFNKFLGKYVVSRYYEMTLYRGMLSTDIKTEINKFINSDN